MDVDMSAVKRGDVQFPNLQYPETAIEAETKDGKSIMISRKDNPVLFHTVIGTFVFFFSYGVVSVVRDGVKLFWNK